MTGQWDGKTCPVCGVGTLHDDVRKERVNYRGRPFVVQQPGAYCDNCGDGITYRDPTEEKAWEAFRESVDASERHELVAIRKRLGLTQRQASDLSGGGHNAFSRYERGEAQPVAAVLNLFRLFDRHPELLAEVDLQSELKVAATWQAVRGREKSARRSMSLITERDSHAALHRNFGAIRQIASHQDILTGSGQFDFPSVPPALLAEQSRKISRY